MSEAFLFDAGFFRRCFNPRSIAVVGATDRSTWSLTAYDNLKAIGFAGELYMVNRRGGSAHGQPAFVSCRDIGAPVDTALLMVPADALQETLADVAAARVAPSCAALVSIAPVCASLLAGGGRRVTATVTHASEEQVTGLGVKGSGTC